MIQAQEVIIDCDPGIDDALALMLAAASTELRLLGVTCVAGNRPVQQTAHNACRVLDVAGCASVPVHAGCARPIGRVQPRVGLVHGADGLGGVVLTGEGRPEPLHATDFLARTLLEAAPGSITLIAVGPLTNLALVEIKHPGALRLARDVLVMGGAAFRRGNITPQAEFNFYADPVAAHVVLGSGARLTVFGLDVTEQAAMPAAWIASLAACASRSAQAAAAMLGAYAAKEPLLHDVCPVAFAIEPSLFRGEDHVLSVDWHDGPTEGRLHAVRPGREQPGNARLITGVEGARLLSLVKERLSRLP
jgi:purine nucleosidase